MSILFRLPVLALAILSAGSALRAEEPEAKPHHWHWSHHERSTFAWQAQVDLPLKELGQDLDHRSGLGLGVQWNHEHSKGHLSRTRLEWNTFSEGAPVGLGAVKTKASNYVLSFDRLYHFSGTASGAYVLGGLGAVRWFLDRTPALAAPESSHTTKLAVTAGAGFRFNPTFSVEARYMLSSVNQSFDGTVLQAGVNLRF